MFRTVKTILIIVGGALMVVLFLRFWIQKNNSNQIPQEEQVNREAYEGILSTPAKNIPVSIADTNQERELGLSYTSSLEKGAGKLFIFEQPEMYGFWMKGMNYPLDLVWISSDMKVVSVTENATPDSYPKVFYPSEAVQYVLEINAFEANAFGLSPNTSVSLKKEF